MALVLDAVARRSVIVLPLGWGRWAKGWAWRWWVEEGRSIDHDRLRVWLDDVWPCALSRSHRAGVAMELPDALVTRQVSGAAENLLALLK